MGIKKDRALRSCCTRLQRDIAYINTQQANLPGDYTISTAAAANLDALASDGGIATLASAATNLAARPRP